MIGCIELRVLIYLQKRNNYLGKNKALSWDDLSSANGLLQCDIKTIDPNSSKPQLFPNLILLSIYWNVTDVTASGSAIRLISLTGFADDIVTSPSNALSVGVRDYADGTVVTLPHTFGTGVSSGHELYYVDVPDAALIDEMICQNIRILFDPGTDNIEGSVRCWATLMSYDGTLPGVPA